MGIQRWHIISEHPRVGVQCFRENDDGTPGEWCKSEDVAELEAELAAMRCCGNCRIYSKCEMYLNVIHKGALVCSSWEPSGATRSFNFYG